MGEVVTETALKEGKYIYCIISSSRAQSFGSLGIGGRGDEVNTIVYDDIAAVVSDSPIKKYAVSRENMLTHEKVIEEVMQKYEVLPVRFVTIAQNEEKVKKILEKEHDKFVGLLKNIKGKKELGLKAVFREEAVYEEILDKYKDIKEIKEAIAHLSPEETRSQRMAVGRMVESALESEREQYKKVIRDALEPTAEKVKINRDYGERMIINAAFLVSKDKEPEFDRRVHELDARYGDKITFKYVGLLPPFNFVNLVIETGSY